MTGPETNERMILASSSPRRAELFRKHGMDVEIIPSDAEESVPVRLTPEQTVMYLSLLKAEDVFEMNVAGKPSPADTIIVASDTIVEKDGEILGKPKDREDARRMVKLLSGTSHRVLTGICVLRAIRGASDRVTECGYDVSEVFFTPIPDDEIEAYIDTPEPYDKAGAYAIQQTFKKYTERYTGDIETIIGFPFAKFEEILTRVMSR